MKKIASLLILLTAVFCCAAVKVDPEKAVIVVARDADGVVRFAGFELQRYLHMITGKKIPVADKAIPGKYPFFMGKPAGAPPLKPEESRWEVTKDFARLYGDSTYLGTPKIVLPRILAPATKSGDLTAVYDFLEKQLNVLFPAPGDENISFTPAPVLTLEEGKGVWVPQFSQRYLWPDRNLRGAARYDARRAASVRQKPVLAPQEFLPATRAEYGKEMFRTWLWLKQQRMGRSVNYPFGHAFTRWWDRFGKTHPEYFALVRGRRRPVHPKQPDRVKLCVSNPAVWKQIVADWAARKDRGHFIDVCENDSGNYCECPECRKLDMPPLPGKKWNDDLSDRYIYFANQVLKEARKIDPEAGVCHYAYSVYRYPPRREKVDPSVYIGFVPSLFEIDRLEEMYAGWYKAGARKIFLRPNDFHVNTPLPMGFEEHMFRAFKTGVKYGVLGTSYDSLHGFWDISGIADYIIARGNVDPSKDFEHWMKEYCSMFGEAASDARAYYDYFRVNIWEKQLWPNRAVIAERGRYGNFRRGLMWDIHKYYKESDFDNAEKILRNGLKKKLNSQQKRRLERMLLANEHSRLTYRALAASGKAKIRAAVNLLKFRRANKHKLNINWERLFGLEIGFGDCTGVKAAELLGDYDDFQPAPLSWYFAPDPKNAGEAEHWEKTLLQEMKKNWTQIRTDTQWENQKNHPDANFRKLMEKYDGYGWYGVALRIDPAWKGKEVSLVFGAVDESAWVWVNGKFAGKRLYANDSDWKTPFAIPITDVIDWNRKQQTVAVRVLDTNGAGGIWRPVMLAVRERKK